MHNLAVTARPHQYSRQSSCSLTQTPLTMRERTCTRQNAQQIHIEDEHRDEDKKGDAIISSNARIKPRTVVVEIDDASTADPAVFGAKWTVHAARMTLSHLALLTNHGKPHPRQIARSILHQ